MPNVNEPGSSLDGLCNICRKDLSLETEAIIMIRVTRASTDSDVSDPTTREDVTELCNNPSCATEAVQNMNIHKTSAVGPNAPGAPGCCNDVNR